MHEDLQFPGDDPIVIATAVMRWDALLNDARTNVLRPNTGSSGTSQSDSWHDVEPKIDQLSD